MHRVVIVGCGFAGLSAAKALRRAPVEVVVVDRSNHHLFQALLYQVATGVLSEGDIALRSATCCATTATRVSCSVRSSTSTPPGGR